MKGIRKRMRKLIRQYCDSDKPWIESVWELVAKGIPEKLIIEEANRYGKEK